MRTGDVSRKRRLQGDYRSHFYADYRTARMDPLASDAVRDTVVANAIAKFRRQYSERKAAIAERERQAQIKNAKMLLLSRLWNKFHDALSVLGTDLVVRPTEAKSYRLMANLRSMGQIDMCQIDHQFATPWQSEADIRKRQVLLSTFDHMLSRELRSTTQRITRFSTNIDASLPYIDKNVRTYIHARLQSGKDKAVFRLTEVLKNIRKMANQRAIFVGHQEALVLSHSMVIEEVRAMKSVSSEIENCLAGCLASIGPGVTEDLVVPNSITECLPHLIAMLNLPEDRKLKRLNRLMGPVTRAGIQLIVNSTSSRFDSLAQSIVYGKPTFASPPLGAKSTSKTAPVFYVLPEMEAKEGELLTEAIFRLDPNGLVFFCDSNACGAAVVTFRFQRFSDIESLLPGILKTDLERALGSPNFQLRFPNGIAHLNRLGISYDPITKTIAFKPVNLTRN